MTGPPQLQLRGIGAPGTTGQTVLCPVDLDQEGGQENVRTHLLEVRSVRDQALRLKFVTQTIVQVKTQYTSYNC